MTAPEECGAQQAAAMERLRSLLAVVPVDAEAKQALCGLVSHASRSYHGVAHLALLWQRHRRYAAHAGLDGPDIDRLIGSAIAYHDAIFHSDRRDNEVRSAELWRDASRNAAMSSAERLWVSETILATADHLGYRPDIACADDRVPLLERARFWMLDLDLTPFGETPAAFDANTARLRTESAHVPAAAYEVARLAFLRRFDASPWIYRSPALAAAFDLPARRNLARALAGA